MREFWRVVKLIPSYKVSNLGRVKRINTGLILSPGVNSRGYHTLTLWHNAKEYPVTVHSLVAKTFIGEYPNKKEVNHIDSCKTNNQIDNLEYVTKRENQIHCIKSGNKTDVKLTEESVRMIRILYNKGFGTVTLAKMFKVHRANIWLIIKRKTWGYV